MVCIMVTNPGATSMTASLSALAKTALRMSLQLQGPLLLLRRRSGVVGKGILAKPNALTTFVGVASKRNSRIKSSHTQLRPMKQNGKRTIPA